MPARIGASIDPNQFGPVIPGKKKTKPALVTVPNIQPMAPNAPVNPRVAQPVPKTPPDPTLAQHGFIGNAQQLDERIGQVRTAFQRARGFDPPAGLAWDVARSMVPFDLFDKLFAPLGLTKSAAKAAGIGAAVSAYQPLETPKLEPVGPVDAAKIAFVQQHPEYGASPEQVDNAYFQSKLKEAGWDPGMLGRVNDFLSPAPLAARQVIQGLAYSPFGVYVLGRAVGLDAYDTARGKPQFRTGHVAKQIAQGFVEDFRDPSHRPGYMFLDLLGLVTAGGGTAARLGAVGRAIGERAGARAVVKAAVTRPEPGTYTFRVGEGAATTPKAIRLERKVAAKEKQLARIKNPKAVQKHTVELARLRTALKNEKATLPDQPAFETQKLLSDNASYRFVQKQVYSRLNQRVAARQAADRVPAATSDLELFQSSKKFYDSWLAGETRLAREAQASRRVEQATRLSILGVLRKTVGYSVRSSRAFSRIADSLPETARFGLTRGENKAIQVLSVGEPISAWEALHNGIIRDSAMWSQELNIAEDLLIRNHERHLADLKLARNILENPDRQTPRFVKAAALAKEVSDEMTRLKVDELGLSPFTSEQRIRSQAAVVRTGKQINGTVADTAQAERAAIRRGAETPLGVEEPPMKGNGKVPAGELGREPTRPFGNLPQGFYSPFVSARNTRRVPVGADTYASRGSEYGFSPPVDLPELNHIFTGDSILAGDFRIDAANLIGDSYARTVRVASLWANYKQLLSASRERPPLKGTDEERWLVPIRNTRTIPPDLKTMLAKFDEGTFTADDAARLGDNAEQIIRQLFPDNAPVKDVRWVDGRLAHKMIGGLASRTTGPGAALYTANELFRLPILFLRPAYILNLLGNVGMGLIHQGLFLGPNVIRSLFAERLYGERATATIDALVGNSRSLSYINPDVRGLAKVFTSGSQAIANWWNKVADQQFRRAAFIHEAHRKGYRTREDMQRLLHEPGLAKDRMEITRRSNKAMVEFDNLTRFEKMWLRNLIFVYPWVSRSAVWSVRTIIEHPIKSDVLAHLGDPSNYDSDPLVKLFTQMKTPAWFKQAGYFPVAFKANGDPKVVSGRSINTFSTLADLSHPFSGMFQSGPETTPLEDLLGPVPDLAIHAVTGLDRYGNKYKGGRVTGAIGEQVGQLPQVSAVKRLQTKPAAPGAKKRPTFVPGLWDAYGPLLTSVLWPREADKTKLEQGYWKEQDPTVRVEHEIQAVRAVAKAQSSALDQPIPAPVKQGLDLLAERMRARARWAEDHGRTPGTRMNRVLDIQVLAKQGLVTPEQAGKLRRQLLDAKTKHDFDRFGALLDKKYLGGDALEQWHSDVNAVMQFEKTYGPAYGRKFLAVKKEQQQLLDAAFSAPAATGDQAIAFAKLAAYEETQDKPVSINGHQYPSPIREAWKLTSPEDQQKTLAKKAGQPWEFLSTFDKELLGRKPSGEAAKGWERFVTFREEAKAKLPAGHRTFPAGYLDDLARYVDRYYAKGFYRDYLVSREPLAQRLMLGGFSPAKLAAPLENSPNRDMWTKILSPAGMYAKLLRNPDYKKSEVRDTWKQYVEQSLLPWARANPSMKKELDLYGPDFLYNLLG